jgi:hypothetical protein
LRATDAVKMITQNSFRLYCIFGLIYHLIYWADIPLHIVAE